VGAIITHERKKMMDEATRYWFVRCHSKRYERHKPDGPYCKGEWVDRGHAILETPGQDYPSKETVYNLAMKRFGLEEAYYQYAHLYEKTGANDYKPVKRVWFRIKLVTFVEWTMKRALAWRRPLGDANAGTGEESCWYVVCDIEATVKGCRQLLFEQRPCLVKLPGHEPSELTLQQALVAVMDLNRRAMGPFFFKFLSIEEWSAERARAWY
jgi:hypothetical protein